RVVTACACVQTRHAGGSGAGAAGAAVTWQDVEVHNDAPGSRTGAWTDPVTGGSTSRRTFLRGVVGLVGTTAASAALTGCGIFGGGGGGPETPDPPQPLLDFLSATSALADRYDATISE